MKAAGVLALLSLLFSVMIAAQDQPTQTPQVLSDPRYTGADAVARAQIDLRHERDLIIGTKPGAPFTAVKVTTVAQTTADGNRITTTASDLVARDSQGRWYRERHRLAPEGTKATLNQPQIYDTVTKTLYHLEPGRRVIVVPNSDHSYRAVRPQPQPGLHSLLEGNMVARAEDLGEKEIGGVRVWGIRWTKTYSPAVAGTSEPVTTIEEDWYSDELGTDVMLRYLNPLSGEVTQVLTDLQRIEPDPMLFKVPIGYTEMPVRRTRGK